MIFDTFTNNNDEAMITFFHDSIAITCCSLNMKKMNFIQFYCKRNQYEIKTKQIELNPSNKSKKILSTLLNGTL